MTVAGSDGNNYTLASRNRRHAGRQPGCDDYLYRHRDRRRVAHAATATATVTVTGAPPHRRATVTLTAIPTTINAGGTSTLTVTAANATSLVIAGSDGTAFTQPALLGHWRHRGCNSNADNYLYRNRDQCHRNCHCSPLSLLFRPAPPKVTITASPSSIATGSSSTLTVVATSATGVTVKGTDGNTYHAGGKGGTQVVSPASTTSYTATADGAGTAPATATATVTVVPPGSVKSINHVIFMLQENHTFDDYFGMLNPYRSEQWLG